MGLDLLTLVGAALRRLLALTIFSLPLASSVAVCFRSALDIGIGTLLLPRKLLGWLGDLGKVKDLACWANLVDQKIGVALLNNTGETGRIWRDVFGDSYSALLLCLCCRGGVCDRYETRSILCCLVWGDSARLKRRCCRMDCVGSGVCHGVY